jgi:NADH:ubiquinone oxidoreductase subunit 5 (subunit L)/multisubunit Na+/H+ antiporter MnhA subunit
VTLLATFVGFLYMARFIRAIFFGPRSVEGEVVKEAPMALLVPQYVLIAGILLLSFFPKLLIEPISAAVDPYFASTLVWEGMSLEMIYGYWNPIPTMALAVAVSAILFAGFWLLQRGGIGPVAVGKRGQGGDVDGVYAFASRLFAALTPSLAERLWSGLSLGTLLLADRTRRIYTGDGQAYCLYVLYYFIALYVACGGLGRFWPLT